MIESLSKGEVFVFGSNLRGFHGGGAARQAYEKFSAEMGRGEGMTGKCYAFPTLDRDFKKRSHEELMESVKKFYRCANENPDKTFRMTPVGTGIATYREDYMKSLFIDAPSNVRKPEGW